MSTFFVVIGWGVGSAVTLGLLFVSFGVFLAATDKDYTGKKTMPWLTVKRATAISVASLLLLAVIITAAINLGVFADDDAAHCGVGTHYLSTGSGKHRSWLCVAGEGK